MSSMHGDVPSDNKIKVDDTFGEWTVIAYAGKYRSNTVRTDQWLCRCSCGNERTVVRGNLRRKLSTKCQSCASRQREIICIDPKYRKVNTTMRHCWTIIQKEGSTWETWEQFVDWWLLSPEPRRGRPFRHDESQPHGPTNTYINIPGVEYTIRLRQSVTGVSYEAAKQWADSVTRQRLQQYRVERGNRPAKAIKRK